ncbi:MAG: polysaccharide pyruvyl transferase family protein [bacterium]|nr:polysaccharide pyruvyl transferase family protein [bacterium]
MNNLRFIHLANTGSTNIGNGALILGAEHTLAEDIPGVTFAREPWDDYTFGVKKFDEQFVRMVNESADALLIGAAVSFNGQPHQKETGTRFELPLPLWDKIKKPIIFYGVSYRHWPFQPYHNLERFKKTMAYVLNAPHILFSVRNDGTKEWIERVIGYASKKIIVIPDPALFVPTERAVHHELSSDAVNIALSLNNEDEVYRFGGAGRELFWRVASPFVPEKKLISFWRRIPWWDARRARFLKELADALEVFSQTRAVNIILCPHYFDDYTIISKFIPFCPIKFPHQNIVSTGMLRVSQTPYFYDLYAQADVALSMRVHSMSPAIGLETPTIALTSQTRMTTFLYDAGLSDFGIDIFDARFKEKLIERLSFIDAHRDEVKVRLRDAVCRMRERTRAFNVMVADFIRARR